MFNCWNRQPLNDDFSPAEVSGKRVLIVIFFWKQPEVGSFTDYKSH